MGTSLLSNRYVYPVCACSTGSENEAPPRMLCTIAAPEIVNSFLYYNTIPCPVFRPTWRMKIDTQSNMQKEIEEERINVSTLIILYTIKAISPVMAVVLLIVIDIICFQNCSPNIWNMWIKYRLNNINRLIIFGQLHHNIYCFHVAFIQI